MVKFIQTHVRLLIIILVGISVILLFHALPVEALENSSPDPSPPPEKGAQKFPFYWVIAIVGGCIAITLTYVSWRKYKADEKKEKTKKNSNS